MNDLSRMLSCAALAMAIQLSVAPSGALAEPPTAADKEEGARLRSLADKAMGALRYEDALEYYVKSYALNPDPAVLFNHGRALEGLGRFPEAHDKLVEFRSAAPASVVAPIRAALDGNIDELARRIATLTVEVEPKGAVVRVGDRILGEAPLKSFRLNAGKVHLEVSSAEYFPETKDIELVGGKETPLTFDLTRRDPTGTLVITSPVAGALVFVDGSRSGQVPLETKLAPGTHTIRLEQSGYEDSETKVEVKTGERKNFEVPLYTKPITYEWWFWTLIGVGLTGGAVGTTYALLSEGPNSSGTMNPEQIAVQSFYAQFEFAY